MERHRLRRRERERERTEDEREGETDRERQTETSFLLLSTLFSPLLLLVTYDWHQGTARDP